MKKNNDSLLVSAVAAFTRGMLYAAGAVTARVIIDVSAKLVKAAKEGMAERKAAKDAFKSEHPEEGEEEGV